MNSGAQRSTEPFEGTPPQRPAASRLTPICRKPNTSVIARPLAGQDESLSIEVVERESEYQLSMPLSGIDPRKVYVLVAPHSLLIEIRFKNVMRHQAIRAVVTESINWQMVREFNLPAEIEQGGTTVRLYGETLQITARKSQHDRQTSWSQLIHFDTRPSLSCALSAAV